MIKALFFWALAATTVCAATPAKNSPSKTPSAKTQAAKASPAPVKNYAQPDYFYTIDLDPRYQFVGTGALTEEDAARAKCYRFVYDPDGEIQQIEYRSAGVPMPDPLLGVARIDFERQPGTERRWFRDAHGRSMRDLFGASGEELKLNGEGFPTDITNLDDSGGRTRDSAGVIRYERTLDQANRLVAGHRVGLLGTDITDRDGYYESRTVYDLQGKAIERGNYDAAGSPLNSNDGIATVRTTYTLFPDSTQTTESYFDASGMAVEDKDTGVHQLQRTLDHRGFIVDEAYFDNTGAPTMTTDNGIHERRFTFDDRGNKLTEEYFDTNGKPVNLRGIEFARTVYKYDDKNRVIELAYFGDDGAAQIPTEVGAAIIRQTYDENGNIVRLQFFDGRGHPSRHVKYGAVAIRLKVTGDTTYVELRNDNDKPTKNPVNGYYAFSYKTASDTLDPTHNLFTGLLSLLAFPVNDSIIYYDRHHRIMTPLRVFTINPHLHALKTDAVMYWSARIGVGAAGLGALLGCLLALRKSSHTKRRKVYVPAPIYRFLGWLSVFAMLEGGLRFVMTIYWAWVGYQNGRMGNGIYGLETIFICFFLYRLYRLTVTMRVLNITSSDLMGIVRDFLTKAGLKPDWIASRNRFVTPPLDVRVNYFAGKNHGYLGFTARGTEGKKLAEDLTEAIRRDAKDLQAPARTRAIALYYPCVALCYFLVAGLAFYTLSQLIIGF